MTISTPKRLGALAFAAAIAVGACSSSGSTTAPSSAGSAAALSGTVTIDGSSTVFPVTQAVAEEFQIANPGVRIPVAFAGTGGGFKKFCAGEIDINDASRPIKTEDKSDAKSEATNCKAANITYVELQVAIDGLTVVVNPQNDFATCLTPAELKTIYGPDSPKDLLWSQVHAGWPAEKVDRYMPGADSGTFDYFTEEINGEVDASTQHATQSEDDNTLVTGVAGSKYGVAYFGYAYYAENTDKLKAVSIDGGSGCIVPSDTTINDGTYTPLSRPLFIYPNVGKAKTEPVLKSFVDYYLANAATYAAEVGYVALPADVAKTQVDAWTSAVGN